MYSQIQMMFTLVQIIFTLVKSYFWDHEGLGKPRSEAEFGPDIDLLDFIDKLVKIIHELVKDALLKLINNHLDREIVEKLLQVIDELFKLIYKLCKNLEKPQAPKKVNEIPKKKEI